MDPSQKTNQNRFANCFPIYKTQSCVCVCEEDKDTGSKVL